MDRVSSLSSEFWAVAVLEEKSNKIIKTPDTRLKILIILSHPIFFNKTFPGAFSTTSEIFFK